MSNSNSVGAGIGLWFVATAIAVGVLCVLGFVFSLVTSGPSSAGEGIWMGFAALIQVGAWQWLYVIPLIISLRRKQRFESAKGLLIFACVLFGIDVLCSGVLLISLSHTSFR